MQNVTVMDIPFVNITKQDLLQEHIYPRLEQKKKTFVVTANPEIVMKTREDAAFKKIVQEADYTVPDGIGIIIAAKWMKTPLQERIAGYDLSLDLLNYANTHQLSCYFLGASEEINQKAVEKVKKDYPNIEIAGNHHGFFELEDYDFAKSVADTQPDIIFVAAGFPKQEKWIAAYKHLFDHGLFIGVGGTFDALAGTVKRAPAFWIKLNLEWFYRLSQQPRTRFKRTLKLFEFMFRVMFNR
ncbi:acetylglucosaminyldiphosphoundecaprenol acetyl-beta-D-mannosaminyltransferase [Oceanobacillus sp. J11TS1]|nr:acetylglucosaminyldiphosphoundecaprenol acetyl-beta-D-mannosaminyltransferase [Oceanobacillus sp. J11TS1]